MTDVDEERRILNAVLDKVESCDLPLPDSVSIRGCVRVEVNWHLQDDAGGTRAVVDAFPGQWRLHPVSEVGKPVLVYADGDVEVTVWGDPEADRLLAEAS